MGKFNVQFDSLNYMKADFTNYKMLLEKIKKNGKTIKTELKAAAFILAE